MMPDMPDTDNKAPVEKEHKYEYDHYVISPDIHFGKHSVFGKHVAIGTGRNSIHIYPSRIYISSGSEGENIQLSPKQAMLVGGILEKIGQRTEQYKKLEHVDGDIKP